MASADHLKSITVLVTGGAGGLGKTIAAAFLAAGSNVAICDVHEGRLSATKAEWAGEYGAERFLVSKTDVTSESAVSDFVSAAVSRFGRVDMLVNNAGVMDGFDPAGSASKDLWDRVIGVNLTGPFLMSREVIRAIEARQQSIPGGSSGGVIINIGSISSYKGLNAGAAYTASKHGLLGLTKNTAGFYGDKGIYCIALLLGGMDDTNVTDAFTGSLNMDGMKRMQETSPGYVQGETNVALRDVAKYCVFLADRDIASSSNGAGISVNKNWPVA